MPDPIALERVWKFYGDYAALRDLSLLVEAGSCCALLGRNGAGKTTLLRILAGLSTFQRGNVSVMGQSPRNERARGETGFLGHGIGVYEDLPAFDNLLFFACVAGIKDAKGTANHWLDRIGLARVAGMPVRQFSRGMRQRLALARTFLHTPKVLLLDEPFTSLDDRAISMLGELLVDARKGGATIIFSTHQLREAFAIASHVALIENGRLCFSGERTPEMLEDPGLLYRQYMDSGVA